MLRFVAETPRQIQKDSLPPRFTSGVVLAKHSFIATLGMTYSVVAPLVTVITVLYFGLWTISYTYTMQYIYSDKHETGGIYLRRAAQQLFAALYLHEVIVIALFLLKKSYIQAGLMIVTLLITIGFHRHANIYDTLMGAVPASVALELEERKVAKAEQERKEAIARGEKVAKKDLDIVGLKEFVAPTPDIPIMMKPEPVPAVPNGVEGTVQTPQASTSKGGDIELNQFGAAHARALSSDTLMSPTSPTPSGTTKHHHAPLHKQGHTQTISRTGFKTHVTDYDGPADYAFHFTHPALRSEKIKLWVVKDETAGKVVEGAVRGKIEADGVMEWKDDYATVDVKSGRVHVEPVGVASFLA